ncbi:tripartite tricarboxylate transporter substrate binding protein [Afipia sp. P52-10]|uniref:Bug family tripartite tricarboxylate transporter substrate binding protein n=1 Tax=Afipia sp. P52-10 TaxID=1429916 RepID=UPI0004B62EB6|nr:tripartite tricarboxylate transporter substrate binding protein [Afipia sp. P52-10]
MKLAGLFGAAVAALGFIVAATPARAQQDYPNRPILWIVPFSPGGVTDNAARFLAKPLGDRLGQTVIVENKPGAGGIVGSEFVANAKPDGYTFLYASSGPMVTIPATRKSMSYDPLAFTPLYGMSASSSVLVVAANKPYKTFAEFVAYAKKNPGKINFASIGTAAAQHLAGELFAMATGIEAVHIPYKGSPMALTDVAAGTVDFMWDFPVVVKPLIDAGQLRPLAVNSDRRLPGLPDVPSVVELGYPQAVFSSWSTVVMPKGVPKDITDKFIKAFGETMADPATAAYFEQTGGQMLPPLPGEKLTEFLKSETTKMKAIIEKAKIPVE